MREFKITYSLNGIESVYYITVSNDNVPARELEESIIYRLKLDKGISDSDDFSLISVV